MPLRPQGHFDTLACATADLEEALASIESGSACRIVALAPDEDHSRWLGQLTARTISVGHGADEASWRVDVADLGAACAGSTRPVMVDNTLAGPWLCRPLETGADVVAERLDVLLGVEALALVGKSPASLAQALTCLGLEDAAGLTRDQEEVASRMLALCSSSTQRRCDTALAVSHYLGAHPLVAEVSYPGLPADAANDRARRVLSHGFGPAVVFSLTDGAEEKTSAVGADWYDGVARSYGRSRVLPLGSRCHLVMAGLESPLDVVALVEDYVKGLQV